MNDTAIKVESTLFGEIRELNEVSWKLDELVFGSATPALPPQGIAEKMPEPDNNIDRMKDMVQEISRRIKRSISKLERMGK